jgi:DNA gyrase subunit A
MLALVNGEPKLLSLKEYFYHFLIHRRDVITNRTLHLLKKIQRKGTYS